MNDPLKKYIDYHRDEFDHLTPPVDLFAKIERELKIQPVEKKATLRLFVSSKWMAAASMIIVLSIGWMLFRKDFKPGIQNGQQTATQKNKVEDPVANLTAKEGEAIPSTQNIAFNPTKRTNKKTQTQINQTNLSNIYADLADSTSSNTRLSAILEIQKSKIISYDMVDRLTNILNKDSNNNVRLAALGVLSQYASDLYVAKNLIQAFDVQTDPVLQIGLMGLLKNIDNPTLDGRLYALANDPNTASAVKDQAYYILMNQNKL